MRTFPSESVVAAAKVLYADKMSNHSGDNAPQIIAACEMMARKMLEAAAQHMMPQTEWGIFRANDTNDATAVPIENRRYRTREIAERHLRYDYANPAAWEVRGRIVGVWRK